MRARAVALAARLALALLALELRHLVLALLRHAVLKVIKRLHHRLAELGAEVGVVGHVGGQH